MQEYYNVLDVPTTATAEQIKMQYRQLVRIYHPDRFANASDKAYAEEKLKQINVAFQVLMGTATRFSPQDAVQSPQPVVYPAAVDLGVVRPGKRYTEHFQVGNLGGPVHNIRFNYSSSDRWFQVAKGKRVYGERPFPLDFEVMVDTRQLMIAKSYQEWIEVDLDGVTKRVPLLLTVDTAPKRTLFFRSPRIIVATLIILLLCLAVSLAPKLGVALPSLDFVHIPYFNNSSHTLRANELLFSIKEEGVPALYVAHSGDQPRALNVIGRAGVGSRAGQRVAYLSGGLSQVYLLDLASGRTQRVSTGDEKKSALAWASGGNSLAYLTGEGASTQIGVYNVAAGKEHRLPGEVAAGVSNFAWSPDGATLLFDLWQGNERRVYQIGVEGDGLTQLTDFDSWAGAWSADGAAVAVVTADGIYQLELQQHKLTQISATSGEAPSWSPDGKWFAYLTAEPDRGAKTLHLLNLQDGIEQLPSTETLSYAWNSETNTIGYVTGRLEAAEPLLYLWVATPGQKSTLVAEVNDPIFQWVQ